MREEKDSVWKMILEPLSFGPKTTDRKKDDNQQISYFSYPGEKKKDSWGSEYCLEWIKHDQKWQNNSTLLFSVSRKMI